MPFNKLRIAICEDDPAAAAFIAELAGRWGEDRRCGALTEHFLSAEAFLFRCGDCQCIKSDCFWDVLLLDIEMAGKKDGLSLARELREKGCGAAVIFITGHKDFVFEGYNVSALNYLVKPVKEDLLFESLDRALDGAKASDNKKGRALVFTAADGSKVRLVEIEIIYAEAEGHFIKVVSVGGVIRLRQPFAELAELLDPTLFCQPHRSYIAGLEHIAGITRNGVTLDNGVALPLSRLRYKGINEAFISYYRKEPNHV